MYLGEKESCLQKKQIIQGTTSGQRRHKSKNMVARYHKMDWAIGDNLLGLKP